MRGLLFLDGERWRSEPPPLSVVQLGDADGGDGVYLLSLELTVGSVLLV
jgi:hypothetical protein